MRFLFLLWCTFLGVVAFAQPKTIYNDDPFQKLPLGMHESEYYYRPANGAHFGEPRVEPPFWWTDMAETILEVMIYDQGIRDWEPQLDYPGVKLLTATRLDNPNYLFLLLEIEPGTLPGTLTIALRETAEGPVRNYPYELKVRTPQQTKAQGVTAQDLIYLIMPDRFANGDTGNDSVAGMKQQGTNRDKVYFRHGGDLIGIMEHLDYLESLGVTTLWLNPVLENDQPYESYHGYAITDHYRIDRRLGTNEQYRQLVQLAHERGLKVIMDVVFNQTGDEHWFMHDLPARDWIHQWQEGFPRISYRAPVQLDPYRSKSDLSQVTESWFDQHMPDLNQQQPQLANYLIQNSIWWTEYSGQDGFRIDTYAYCDQEFMSRWNQRILREYPQMGIFAETYVHGTGIQSWFTEGTRANAHNSHLPGVTDFQLYYAITESLMAEQGWTSGVARLYYTLAQDYLYQDPYRNVLFLDNHDLGRIYGVLGEDLEKFKSGIALLLTLRGIPMLYYGTELLLTGTGGSFSEGGRKDFPGGFPRDKPNKFKERGRTDAEQEAFAYIQTLANYRKAQQVLQDGQLMQFVPEDGVYVYFRYNANQTVMVAYNSNARETTIRTARFAEQLTGFSVAKNIVSGVILPDISQLVLPAHWTLVLELQE